MMGTLFYPIFDSGPPKNDSYRHLESNALIGTEIYEFRQKLKNLEFRQHLIFWESLGAIWIDSVSFEVVPPLSFFFIFFQFLSLFNFVEKDCNFLWKCELFFVKLSIFDGNVNFDGWLKLLHLRLSVGPLIRKPPDP